MTDDVRRAWATSTRADDAERTTSPTSSEIKRCRMDPSRRYVFLCPTSLSKHYESLPIQARDHCLMVFRCHRQTVFPESKDVRRSRTNSRVDCGLKGSNPVRSVSGESGKIRGHSHYNSFTCEFLQWVSIKEEAGCVFWLKPDKDLSDLSSFFQNQTPPEGGGPYSPLMLDPHWWRVHFVRGAARFVPNPSVVISALSDASLAMRQNIDVLALQELIYQSDPSFEPVFRWPHAPSMRFLPRPITEPQDFAEPPSYRGYIDHDRALSGRSFPASFKEQPRIAIWPSSTCDRLDYLHQRWQTEESHCARRKQFSLTGMSAMRGNLTAR